MLIVHVQATLQKWECGKNRDGLYYKSSIHLVYTQYVLIAGKFGLFVETALTAHFLQSLRLYTFAVMDLFQWARTSHMYWITRLTRKGPQSKRATASLFMMEKKRKLVIFLPQESRHIVGSYWGKQRCIFPAERKHVGIGAVVKNMLLILSIISITQVTGGGITLIPCRCLKMQGVNTKSETSCTANDTTRQVEKHVFGKDIRRMSDQSPFGRKRTIN